MRARSTAPLVLFAFIFFASPGRGGAAGDPFADCKITAANREGWKAICAAGWLLSLTDGPPDFRAKDYTDGIVTGLRAATGGEVRRENATLALPGGAWTITRFQVTGAHEPGPAFTYFAVAERKEGPRVVSCSGTTETEASCKRAMQVVAAAAWRAGPPASAARGSTQALIAGRAYKAPKGCEVTTQPNATFVGCAGEPVLLWAQPPNDLTAIEGLMTAQMRESGMKESAGVGCQVEGVKAKCRVYRPIAAGDRRVGYWARATVRDQPIAVICLSNDGRRPLPAACAEVLSLDK